MNKILEKKCNLVKRLYEINIILARKYGIEIYPLEEYIVNTPFNKSVIIGTLPKYGKEYIHFISIEKEDELIKALVDYWLWLLMAEKNDDISPQTEEFWEIVELENLKVKRKNNTLLNILNKGYIGGGFDREIFYFGIEELVKSDVFKRIYGLQIEKEIRLLIDNQIERLINNAEKIVKKKKKLQKDYYQLDDIVRQFQIFDMVLKAPADKLELFKTEVKKMESYL